MVYEGSWPKPTIEQELEALIQQKAAIEKRLMELQNV
jgi:hypothetical protein